METASQPARGSGPSDEPGRTSGKKRAGVPGRIPHDFRRTAVRNLERAGVSRSAAMKMVGYRTESIYRRYAIVSESDLLQAGQQLAALHGTDRQPTATVVPLSR